VDDVKGEGGWWWEEEARERGCEESQIERKKRPPFLRTLHCFTAAKITMLELEIPPLILWQILSPLQIQASKQASEEEKRRGGGRGPRSNSKKEGRGDSKGLGKRGREKRRERKRERRRETTAQRTRDWVGE